MNYRAEIMDTWNSLPDDQSRWDYLSSGIEHGLIIILDNDSTQVRFKEVEFDDDDFVVEYDLKSFDFDIGNRRGIPVLLNSINIDCEMC